VAGLNKGMRNGSKSQFITTCLVSRIIGQVPYQDFKFPITFTRHLRVKDTRQGFSEL